MLRSLLLPPVLLTATALTGAAQAQQRIDTDLELVLMADASGSITNDEILFQRRGYAQAMTHPEVIAAIGGTAYGSIAVTYVEWGQADSQVTVVPWMRIENAASAGAFSTALMAAPRIAHGYNAIGAALLYGQGAIEGNQITGWRRIIDFSGDSTRNFNGPSIEEARAQVLAAGITINGLALACADCAGSRRAPGPLAEEFRDRIIGGPGAFVVTAEGEAAFAEAVRRKLVMEISDLLSAPSEIPG